MRVWQLDVMSVAFLFPVCSYGCCLSAPSSPSRLSFPALSQIPTEWTDNMHSHQKQTNLQQAREVPLKACKTIKHPFQRACALHVISICQQEDQTTPCRAPQPKPTQQHPVSSTSPERKKRMRPWDSRFRGLALATL